MNNVSERNNVKVFGNKTAPAVILAHGFGCDQNMWRFIAPELALKYQVVIFDYVGSGNSSLGDYTKEKYEKLDGYAQDIIDVICELNLTDVTIIGHSVSAIIASIAYIKYPQIISKIIMVCPSPCFLNFPPDYQGGFEKSDLEELIQLMDKNYIGWANYLAPLVMGTSQPQELISELSGSFCSTDPLVAKTFAKATFFSDYRHILPEIICRVLIIQSSLDSLASIKVGHYMSEKIPNNDFIVIDAEGHCLHMTHHKQIIPKIIDFIES
ncbi:alpha/beta fold hydrolase [Shewanella aestuarii]|uniref:Alpha/beta hydrolase n=1 Tax=Shewanella aestuarii TaxID=1028752 RepID=A0A6G9QLS7_9GAMM|nr:alpha/beta hydrolase [Shewanella aestuarii]QIR14997.1 alpha/beta hydrolase [Shewanella aestuarii]